MDDTVRETQERAPVSDWSGFDGRSRAQIMRALLDKDQEAREREQERRPLLERVGAVLGLLTD